MVYSMFNRCNRIKNRYLSTNNPEKERNRLLPLVQELMTTRKYHEAISVLSQINELNVQIGKKYHHENAVTLSMLGALHEKIGDYNNAELNSLQAIDIFRSVFGGVDPKNLLDYEEGKLWFEQFFVPTIVRLSGLYSTTRPDKAEACFKEACSATLRVAGESSPIYASILHSQALLYRDAGRYDIAEPLFKKAIEILGEEHPKVAKSLNSLGVLYFKIGDYDDAKPILKRALNIWRKAGMENTAAFAACLNNLGLIYNALGFSYKAYFDLTQALGIRKNELGEEHPEVAESLMNLASYYEGINSDIAERLCVKAIEILRKAGMENTSTFSACLQLMGRIYVSKGLHEKAESTYLKSLDVSDKILDSDHNRVIHLKDLALLYIAQKRLDDALRLFREIIAIEDKEIPITFSFGSERQRMLFLKALSHTYYLYLSIVINSFSHDENVLLSALDLVLKRKALGAEALHQLRLGISRNPGLRTKLDELNQLRISIEEHQMHDSSSDISNTDQRTYLSQLLDQKETLEKDLAGQLPEIRLQEKLGSSNTAAISNAMPAHSLLVEFVKYDHLDFSRLQEKNDLHRESHYAAFILYSENPIRVRVVDLGNAEKIDKEISNYLSWIKGESGKQRKMGIEEIRTALSQITEIIGARNLIPSSRIEEKMATNNGHLLRSMLVDPLVSFLDRRRKIFVALDGDLTRLPFEILPSTNPVDLNSYLIDEYNIIYISTGSDFLRFKPKPSGYVSLPVVAADPDYNLNIESIGKKTDYPYPPFQTLSGTRQEGVEVGSMLGVEPLLGRLVLERDLKKMKSPFILHIASHGFFFPNQVRAESDNGAFLKETDLTRPYTTAFAFLENLYNPLLRSGLALAGANTRLLKGVLPPEAEDGILTAEDVSIMDLSNTELVVLSACETGLGDIYTGEGVFGLQRSFALSGVQTLVMSLWKVPDKETSELMKEFYSLMLAAKPTSRSDALRKAKLYMKEKHPSPLYWGAFICQGNPTVLGPLPRTIPLVKDETMSKIFGSKAYLYPDIRDPTVHAAFDEFDKYQELHDFSVDDLQKAKEFYGQTLGLDVSEAFGGKVLFLHIAGRLILISPKADHTPATFPVLNFPVDNLELAMDNFTKRGVRFVIYNDDDVRTDDKGIFLSDEGRKIAWFKDPAGNLLALLEKTK